MVCSIRRIGIGAVVAAFFFGPLHAQLPADSQQISAKHDAVIELADHLVDSTNHWLRWYGTLPSNYQRFLQRVAVGVARFRRAALKQLIELAPERALENRLGAADRAQFPPKVVDQLETIVDTTGDYQAPLYLHFFDEKGLPAGDELQPGSLTLASGQFMDPGIYGRREGLASKIGLPVHGIAIDEAFAWLDEPFRFLDPAELQELQLPPDASALLSGGKVLLIDDEDDENSFESIRERLRMREIKPGPFLADGVIDEILLREWTTGEKNILWVPIDFPSMPGSRYEQSPTTDAIIDKGDQWIRQTSRDRSGITVTYFPGVLTLPDAARDAALDQVRSPTPPRHPSSLIAATREALEAYDRMNGDTGQWLPDSYDRLLIAVSDSLTFEEGGTAGIYRGAFSTFGVNLVFYGLIDQFEIQHELGHTYLFGHSVYSVSATSDPLGPTARPDWMPWDFMGVSEATAELRHHPSASAKEGAYWMQQTATCTATTDPLPEVCNAHLGGTFRIVAHDNGPDGRLRALRIPLDDRIYWVAMRRLWPEKLFLHTGVQISYTTLKVNRPNTPDGLEGPIYVGLRNTAYIPSAESPFQAGEMLEDSERGVRIIVSAVGSEAGVPYADVTVERF